MLSRCKLSIGSSNKLRACFSTSVPYMDASAKLNKPARFATPISASDIPKGFVVSSTYAGIKAAIAPKPANAAFAGASNPNPKPDVGLIVSTVPAAAAGTFTRNVFKAAPVVVSARTLLDGAKNNPNGARVQSVLVNSGCANAVTGTQGMQDAEQCVELVKSGIAPHANLSKESQGRETLLLSTGVIGVPLPMPAIKKCIPHLTSGQILRSDPEAWHDVARAFMTTDTFPKLRAKTFKLGGKDVRMVGIDKGAGMIHPAMTGLSPSAMSSGAMKGLHATLLGFIATDAAVKPAALQTALERAVSRSFNCISVDGDMSTNDTILLLANGQSAPSSSLDAELDESSPDFDSFVQHLTTFCQDLSKLIVRDGEGAEKFVEITVVNAPSYDVAHGLLSKLVTSMLFKCALHGSDANWGRILASVGGSDPSLTEQVDPLKVSVSFAELQGSKSIRVLSKGQPVKVDEEEIAPLLQQEDIKVVIDLDNGTEQCTYWTCDLSREYININADYRS